MNFRMKAILGKQGTVRTFGLSKGTADNRVKVTVETDSRSISFDE